MTNESIDSVFSVFIRDTNYNIVARLDSWNALSYELVLNDVGSYSISLPYDDPRTILFGLDGIVEIYRSLPGFGIEPYPEFVGLHRSEEFEVKDNGEKTFIGSGVGLNNLLSRRIINYPMATIKSEKSDLAETVMKEYVEENCGYLATTAWNREIAGVMARFQIEPSAGNGELWEGDRAYENLLEVIKDISTFAHIDFAVKLTTDLAGEHSFGFYTYFPNYGANRSQELIDINTGKNIYGNVPVLFSAERGNVKYIKYSEDRMSEATSVSVLGDGDGATRFVKVVNNAIAMTDSPYNQIEVARPQGGFESQMQTAGEEILNQMKVHRTIEFQPLLQASCMYGVHYFLGDVISVLFKGIIEHKKIISVTNSIENIENLQFIFQDV